MRLFPKSKRKEERRDETTVTSEERREKLESAEEDVIFAGFCFSRISLSLVFLSRARRNDAFERRRILLLARIETSLAPQVRTEKKRKMKREYAFWSKRDFPPKQSKEGDL
jgi:hypothetical protein